MRDARNSSRIILDTTDRVLECLNKLQNFERLVGLDIFLELESIISHCSNANLFCFVLIFSFPRQVFSLIYSDIFSGIRYVLELRGLFWLV